jgi:hypothetical protein
LPGAIAPVEIAYRFLWRLSIRHNRAPGCAAAV